MASESKDNFSFDILNIHDFLQNRDPRRDITFDDEQILKSYIINNDPRALEFAMSLFNVDRMGEMSKDPQKQIIMGCIASITLNTRSFVRAGIPLVHRLRDLGYVPAAAGLQLHQGTSCGMVLSVILHILFHA